MGRAGNLEEAVSFLPLCPSEGKWHSELFLGKLELQRLSEKLFRNTYMQKYAYAPPKYFETEAFSHLGPGSGCLCGWEAQAIDGGSENNFDPLIF